MEDVRRALDAATRWLRAPPEERAAVRRYQSLAGSGERLNALLYVGTPLDGVLYDVAMRLDALLERASLPVDVVAWRGVGDIDEVVPPLDGEVLARAAFLSATLDEGIARRDFAVGPRPALLRLALHRGVPALWVPPVGRRDLAYEQELLLPRATPVRYGRRTLDGDVTIVWCEVMT
ncbi:MAG TPA: ADP-ribosyltransferase [Mycobacteriales bacterium]|jgi:hypothetical protein